MKVHSNIEFTVLFSIHIYIKKVQGAAGHSLKCCLMWEVLKFFQFSGFKNFSTIFVQFLHAGKNVSYLHVGKCDQSNTRKITIFNDIFSVRWKT